MLGMRRPKLAKEPRTTLACVGTHAVRDDRWQRWMLPRREFEKWDGEREEGFGSSSTLTCCRLLLSEITIIHYRSFTDLLAECSPTVPPAEL